MFWEKCLDFVLPPRCLITGEEVDEQGMLSPSVWKKLNFIAEPYCMRCGFPFDFLDKDTHAPDALCPSCLKEPPSFDWARSSLIYDDVSRDLILRFKHGDMTQAVPVFMPWLKRSGGDLLAEADYLLPVPLHRWRLLKRRYNQAALIAQLLSKQTGIPVLYDGLSRIRHTAIQGHMDAKGRRKNVKNAFCVSEKRKSNIHGKHIVIIDDVFTTGATVEECAKELYKAGAQKIGVLALARVVKPTRL